MSSCFLLLTQCKYNLLAVDLKKRSTKMTACISALVREILPPSTVHCKMECDMFSWRETIA